MPWHLQIGFDEGIMKKVDPADKTRQKFIFSMLTIMIIFTSLLVLASSVVYLLIVFHNWFVAITAGLFLSLVVFNLYRLLIITAVNAEKSGIGEYLIHHEKLYEDFIESPKANEISNYPPETILKIVNNKKYTIGDKTENIRLILYKLVDKQLYDKYNKIISTKNIIDGLSKIHKINLVYII